MFILVAIIAIIFLHAAWVDLSRIALAANVKKRLSAISKLKQHYHMEHLYVSLFNKNAIGLNFATRKVLLGPIKSPSILPFDQIIQVDILEDAGVFVAGPHSALLGMKRNIESRIGSLAIRVIVEKGAFRVVFFEGGAAYNHQKNLRILSQTMDTYYAHLLNAIRSSQRTKPSTEMEEVRKISDFAEAPSR